MGKKVKRKTYTSKGERNAVSRSTTKLMSSTRSEIDKALNKLNAWRSGKNPWITVPGTQSNMRMVRVRANAAWGDPKKVGLLPNIYRGKSEE